ncbi:MAG TPA: NAD(+) diphosphatase [Dehalococcoidia bacterium]|nr:NAD(+) diphosphatase [Dehalococcoidia bacterium]
MQNTIPFSGNPLDRAANQRREDAWVTEHLQAGASRYLAFSQLNVLAREAEGAELHWLDASVCEHLEDGAAPLLLGLRDGIAHFAVDLSSLTDPIASIGIEGAGFADSRRIATDLPEGDAGILAQARALLDWHARHRYCGSCGSATTVCAGGSMRKCASCGDEHYPNPHPVVIMVAWRGDRCLLGSGRAWAQQRYSALAGFMDQGETIEEAVAREVKEEVGLDVDEVVYHTSQPWPFPSNLMIGCFAHVAGEALTVDPVELSGARWFSREEIGRALDNPDSVDFGLPGRIAIAHHLIRAWVARRAALSQPPGRSVA